MNTFNPVPKSKWTKYNKKKGLKSKREKCEDLWKKIVRFRAGYVSELSQRNFVAMDCHHILGKGTLALRFSFENAIFITRSEHVLAHSLSSQEREFFLSQVAKIRGANFKENIQANLKRNLNIDQWLEFLKSETRRLGIGK